MLYLYMRLKGISPIIASVLLIIFSTIIAALVGTWAKSYVSTELTNLRSCQNINLVSPNFNYNPATKEGNITIQNVGGEVDGYIIYAFADLDKREVLKRIKQKFSDSESVTISFKVSTLQNMKGIIVETINCPGVSLTIPINQ